MFKDLSLKEFVAEGVKSFFETSKDKFLFSLSPNPVEKFLQRPPVQESLRLLSGEVLLFLEEKFGSFLSVKELEFAFLGGNLEILMELGSGAKIKSEKVWVDNDI